MNGLVAAARSKNRRSSALVRSHMTGSDDCGVGTFAEQVMNVGFAVSKKVTSLPGIGGDAVHKLDGSVPPPKRTIGCPEPNGKTCGPPGRLLENGGQYRPIPRVERIALLGQCRAPSRGQPKSRPTRDKRRIRSIATTANMHVTKGKMIHRLNVRSGSIQFSQSSATSPSPRRLPRSPKYYLLTTNPSANRLTTVREESRPRNSFT